MKAHDVLIADDSARARRAIRLILDGSESFRVVAEATTGIEAVDLAKQLTPDIVLMDIHMPQMDGLRATRLIKRELPNLQVVMLSVSDDAADLFEAIRCGAQGYLVKSLDPSDWLSYLQGVLDGETPMSKVIAQRILAEFRSPDQSTGKSPESGLLTQRELEILDFVRQGATNREIATRLFISENTVKNHLKNVMAKLHIENRVQLAAYAAKHQQ
ncbi:response regulator [Alicyclobacillus sp. ALC3]|uniref:response regulator n=1 Tax=Alicyclobacillus sp. ALC3 TaxID=2796143 RepID=UPI002377FB04|nr:response regulator transcription factor [Alicyclobacillus sp. ALC3]WDL99246.1 response regulator transcription factor [Alicyclobacillus sp. ALC3]